MVGPDRGARAELPDSLGRQSAASELAWLEDRRDRPGQEVLAELVRQRVARRHLDVACRKLARQNAYTFLFDVENGRIRARTRRPVGPSGSRIGTAMRFLTDARILADGVCIVEREDDVIDDLIGDPIADVEAP